MENKNIIRFIFTKQGGLKYISHLDLQRAIARIIKRSHIPIRYTQGFNPHPKMVFALTLGVGCESVCELLDVYMVMDESKPNVPLFTADEFKAAIIPNLPKGLELVDAFYPEKSFNEIQTAEYNITIELNNCEDITARLNTLLSNEMIVFKKSKAGDRNVDILPMIEDYAVSQSENVVLLKLLLSARQNNYLSPELVMTGLKNDNEVNKTIDYYTVTRTAINFN